MHLKLEGDGMVDGAVLGKRRSELGVMAAILSVRGCKTAIMYGGNLSYAQTQKYLALLQEMGFLKQVHRKSGRNIYLPTEKGKKLLDLFNALEAVLGDVA